MSNQEARPIQPKAATVTEREMEALLLIAREIDCDAIGRSPKLRTIGAEMGIRTGTAWELVTHLRARGCLIGEPDRTRRLRLTDVGRATIADYEATRKRIEAEAKEQDDERERFEYEEQLKAAERRAKKKESTRIAAAAKKAVTAKKPLDGKKTAVAVRPAPAGRKTAKKPKLAQKSTGKSPERTQKSPPKP